jgi:pyruvate,water dikinase
MPVVKGIVRIINADYQNPQGVIKKMHLMKKGEILVAQTTSPNRMVVCMKAGAIITDVGGVLSHAAIISRELNIPCIVGTEISSTVLRDGDFVEVNTTNGTVSVIGN